MNLTPQQAAEILARLERNRKRKPPDEWIKSVADSCVSYGDDHESKVRKQITKWCDDQWPPWVYWGARPDVKSTLPKGCHDLTLAGPDNQTLFIDTKSKTGKPSPDQLIWRTRLRAVGRELYFVKTFDQFLAAVEENRKASQ